MLNSAQDVGFVSFQFTSEMANREPVIRTAVAKSITRDFESDPAGFSQGETCDEGSHSQILCGLSLALIGNALARKVSVQIPIAQRIRRNHLAASF
jgi:hypothetical protein